MADLHGKVAVVTGGNGGIGLGMAEGLVAAGADVAIWGRDEGKNADAAAHLRELAPDRRVVALRCDVADEQQVVDATTQTVDALGRIDACIANAGVSHAAPITEMSLADWRRVMAVNLDGAFLTMREVAKRMIAQGDGGAMVAVSSTSAIHGAGDLRYGEQAGCWPSSGRRGGVGRHGIRVSTVPVGAPTAELGYQDDRFRERRHAARRCAGGASRRLRGGGVPVRPLADVPHRRHARGRRGYGLLRRRTVRQHGRPGRRRRGTGPAWEAAVTSPHSDPDPAAPSGRPAPPPGRPASCGSARPSCWGVEIWVTLAVVVLRAVVVHLARTPAPSSGSCGGTRRPGGRWPTPPAPGWSRRSWRSARRS